MIKSLVVKKFLMALVLLLTITNAGAVTQQQIWQKASEEVGFQSFVKDIQTDPAKKGWMNQDGSFTVTGLCKGVYNTAKVNGLLPTGITSETSYCDLFKWQNALNGKEAISPAEFRRKSWFLPNDGTVLAFQRNGQVTATSVKTEAKVTKPKSAPAPPTQLVDINRINQRLLALEQRLVQNSISVKEVTSLRREVQNLQRNFLTKSDLDRVSLQFLEEVNSRFAGFAKIEAQVNQLEQRLGTLDDKVTKQEHRIDAAMPLGYGRLKDVFGTMIANRYAEMAGWIQLATFLILFGLVSFLYASIKSNKKGFATVDEALQAVHGKYQSLQGVVNSSKQKIDDLVIDVNGLTEEVEQMEELVTSTSVHSDLDYTFDQSLVDKIALLKLPIGNSIKLELKPVAGKSLYIEVERTDQNEATLHGLVRQIGVKTPVSSNLGKVVYSINKAIRDGRVVGTAALKAVA